MRLSKNFIPAIKEKPAEALIASHELMLRSGMIKQQASGIYSWLPLGLKILKKIENIVRLNMTKSGALEILMPCIQPAHLWQESGRFDSYGKEMLKFNDRHDYPLLFGPTNEDLITDIFRHTITSYKELPKNLFHIQWKFRDEIRPRFGVMRAREFLMKDSYSFDIDEQSAIISYNHMYITYMKIFLDLGLKAIPVKADNGPIGGNLSHEFHILSSSGESTIYYDKNFDFITKEQMNDIKYLQSCYAAVIEKHDEKQCPLSSENLRISKSIEVGHIFYIGTKYAESMQALIMNKEGKKIPFHLSSYGIGISRLVGAIIEANHDEKGIIWPKEVAPFLVSIINLVTNNNEINQIAENIYQSLNKLAIDVLYDDTEKTAGQKFALHDLIGSPWQIIIGKKAAQNIIELKNRRTGEIEELTTEEVIKRLEIVNK